MIPVTIPKEAGKLVGVCVHSGVLMVAAEHGLYMVTNDDRLVPVAICEPSDPRPTVQAGRPRVIPVDPVKS
jgi:hypothetical protein